MEIRRKAVDRRVYTISSTAKYFRRFLYGLIGVVLSAYIVLFIVVVSRHIDQSAQNEVKKALTEESRERTKVLRPVGLVGGLGPSLLGMDRFQERWAAVARVLNTNDGRAPRVRRRLHICLQPRFRNPPGPMIALASFPGSGNTWVRFLVQQATGEIFFDSLITGSNSWVNFVQTHSRLWMESVLDWLQFQGPLMVLRYETIIDELPSQLIHLLKFLDTNVSWNAFQCVLRNRDGIFRRARKQLNFDLFDDSLKKIVEGYKKIVEMALYYHEQGIKFDISNTTLSQDADDGLSNVSVLPVTYVDKDQNIIS
ncbi:WSCD family member AAEL009094 [Parasteatoda tepidariorum]|uniref:WSCD family member AAEL009094 n=1 Tax=Parasteatoda tepidariorum TaxID=114398 RepID=UPI0039BC23F6